MGTDKALSDTIATALTESMDKGTVNCNNYPVSHCAALFEQQRIGRHHIFAGHLSQQWEILQGNTAKNDKSLPKHQWAATIVTVILKQVINLWEMRNKEVHRATKSEQQNKLLAKQKREDNRTFRTDIQMPCERSISISSRPK